MEAFGPTVALVDALGLAVGVGVLLPWQGVAGSPARRQRTNGVRATGVEG